MITSIKLFYLDGNPMVALYGGDHEEANIWQCNLPAGDVISSDPYVLPAEQEVPLAEASKLVIFTPQFGRQLKPQAEIQRVPQLVRLISQATQLPAPQVRKIVLEILEQIATVVEKGERLDVPELIIRPRRNRPFAVAFTKPKQEQP
jgi:hypothetical protein